MLLMSSDNYEQKLWIDFQLVGNLGVNRSDDK